MADVYRRRCHGAERSRMKPELGPTPDEVARAKMEEMHKAQDRMREQFAIKEASTFAPPELSRAQRRRLQRDRKHMKGLRP